MSLPKNKDFNDYDNYITDTNPTTSAQAQDYFRIQAALLKAVIDTEYWQPETNYANGAVVKSDSMPAGTEAICVAVNGGASSNVEPQWGSVGGANISDGTCFWHLRYRAVSVNNIEADNKGNITIPVMRASTNVASGADGLVPAPPATSNELFLSNEGEWKEAGKVKSVNGKTGDVVVDLPVGHMYWSIEPTVSAGRLPASGALYNRPLYQGLYNWADERGLVISESEWQAIASANDGNCAYYSSGDGSSTFRVPSIKCWIKGANASGSQKTVGFDASRSNSIYGNSDTVQPPSLVGQWLIVAFGVAHNIGEADVANVMGAVERVQTSIGTLEQGVGTAIDYIVESYRNGTEWYKKYKSGWVEQGGINKGSTNARTITLNHNFANTNYTVVVDKYANDANNWTPGAYPLGLSGKTTTSFVVGSSNDMTAARYITWYACGQGA